MYMYIYIYIYSDQNGTIDQTCINWKTMMFFPLHLHLPKPRTAANKSLSFGLGRVNLCKCPIICSYIYIYIRIYNYIYTHTYGIIWRISCGFWWILNITPLSLKSEIRTATFWEQVRHFTTKRRLPWAWDMGKAAIAATVRVPLRANPLFRPHTTLQGLKGH